VTTVELSECGSRRGYADKELRFHLDEDTKIVKSSRDESVGVLSRSVALGWKPTKVKGRREAL